MKRQASRSKHQDGSLVDQSHERHSYQRVVDGRKQPIRGLYTRNGTYIPRLAVELANGSKAIKLVPLTRPDGRLVESLSEARASFDKLRTQSRENEFPVLRAVPTLEKYVPRYIAHRKAMTGSDAKRPATVGKDSTALARWITSIGGLRLDQIRPVHMIRHRDQMLKEGYGTRSANLALIALRGLCKHAKLEGFLKFLPMADIPKLREPQGKRKLVSMAEIERLCNSAREPKFKGGRLVTDCEKGVPLRNAEQFADYSRFMAFTGARRCEALRVLWADVDFDRQTVLIGGDGLAKNHEHRRVDFNSQLTSLLNEMRQRRAPDTRWLFPSPQRGGKDLPAKTFEPTFRLAREASGLPHITFHDCRHLFISFSVMSGIDFLTIARWVGHKDGGILIGKVYGHLSNEHARTQASRLRFEPQIVQAISL